MNSFTGCNRSYGRQRFGHRARSGLLRVSASATGDYSDYEYPCRARRLKAKTTRVWQRSQAILMATRSTASQPRRAHRLDRAESRGSRCFPCRWHSCRRTGQRTAGRQAALPCQLLRRLRACPGRCESGGCLPNGALIVSPPRGLCLSCSGLDVCPIPPGGIESEPE